MLAGEAEEVFADIAAALERGTARRLYRVSDKPDMTRSPVPRYDLIRLDKYKSMPVQFSRGCPFHSALRLRAISPLIRSRSGFETARQSIKSTSTAYHVRSSMNVCQKRL